MLLLLFEPDERFQLQLVCLIEGLLWLRFFPGGRFGFFYQLLPYVVHFHGENDVFILLILNFIDLGLIGSTRNIFNSLGLVLMVIQRRDARARILLKRGRFVLWA